MRRPRNTWVLNERPLEKDSWSFSATMPRAGVRRRLRRGLGNFSRMYCVILWPMYQSLLNVANVLETGSSNLQRLGSLNSRLVASNCWQFVLCYYWVIGLSPFGPLCVIGGRSRNCVLLDEASGLIRVRLISFNAFDETHPPIQMKLNGHIVCLSILSLWSSFALGCN